MKINTQHVIKSLRPGANFKINKNGDYSSIVWNDDTQTQPTEEEITTKANEEMNSLVLQVLRAERDTLLKESDKYTLSDYPHTSDEMKQKWLTYRQQLRDLPSQTTNPTMDDYGILANVTWPTLPE